MNYMKFIIFFFAIFFFSFIEDSSVYDVTVTNLDGSSIILSTYKGKKMLIYEFDGSNPDSSQLKYLDSLQRIDSLHVIAVPATDFGPSVTTASLSTLRDSLQLSYPLSQPATVQKITGTSQIPLFHWLTNVSENTHFDDEVDQPGKMYLISEQGILYAVLGAATSKDIIGQVVKQVVSE